MGINEILFQAGMVGAFIVFALILIRIESGERSKRLESFKEFIQQRDDLMVDLLGQERDTRKAAAGGAIAAIQKLTETIAKMDENSNDAHQEILIALTKLNGKT